MHVHMSGLATIVTALEVIVVFGALNLLAIKYKDSSPLAASWLNIFNHGAE